MLENFIILIAVLLIIAALAGGREAGSFVFTILYLLAGALILGRLWSGRALAGLSFTRKFVPRAFWGEEIPVHLTVSNRSPLPVLWLRLQEAIPVELAPPTPMRQVISLGPRGQASLDYVMRARKRGYYLIGPLVGSSGDLLGLAGESRIEGAQDYLTVYPRIIHLSRIELPSHSPMGTLRHKQPIYEDPTRVLGKRDYVAGDSLRRVDWKATAITGRLQVKLFEPSIALTTAIFLDLNEAGYHRQTRLDALELAIVAAASIANWIVGQKQNVGLVTNGLDPLAGNAALIEDGSVQAGGKQFKALSPSKGRAHLMRILDVLARVQAAETTPVLELLHQESLHLPWGTTIILITGSVDDRLFDQLFCARQAGLSTVLVLVGQVPNRSEAKARGRHFGFPVYHLRNEADLDVWRG